MLVELLGREAPERLVVPVARSCPEHLEAVGQTPLRMQRSERRQQEAPRQVPARAEEHKAPDHAAALRSRRIDAAIATPITPKITSSEMPMGMWTTLVRMNFAPTNMRITASPTSR